MAPPLPSPIAPIPPPDSRHRTAGYFVALFMLGVIEVFLAGSIVPRFHAIFQDMLIGRRLPAATTFVIDYRWLLAALGCTAVAIAGFLARRRSSPGWFYAAIALLVLQIGFTVIALFIPLHTIIRAMSPPQ